MAEHSELPWTTEDASFYEILRDANGNYLADIEWPLLKSERQANASYIVRACNERPDILRVLENICANAVVQPDKSMDGTTDTFAVPLDDIYAARAALSRANGDEK